MFAKLWLEGDIVPRKIYGDWRRDVAIWKTTKRFLLLFLWFLILSDLDEIFSSYITTVNLMTIAPLSLICSFIEQLCLQSLQCNTTQRDASSRCRFEGCKRLNAIRSVSPWESFPCFGTLDPRYGLSIKIAAGSLPRLANGARSLAVCLLLCFSLSPTRNSVISLDFTEHS